MNQGQVDVVLPFGRFGNVGGERKAKTVSGLRNALDAGGVLVNEPIPRRRDAVLRSIQDVYRAFVVPGVSNVLKWDTHRQVGVAIAVEVTGRQRPAEKVGPC